MPDDFVTRIKTPYIGRGDMFQKTINIVVIKKKHLMVSDSPLDSVSSHMRLAAAVYDHFASLCTTLPGA